MGSAVSDPVLPLLGHWYVYLHTLHLPWQPAQVNGVQIKDIPDTLPSGGVLEAAIFDGTPSLLFKSSANYECILTIITKILPTVHPE